MRTEGGVLEGRWKNRGGRGGVLDEDGGRVEGRKRNT